jgi:hypothetical protein
MAGGGDSLSDAISNNLLSNINYLPCIHQHDVLPTKENNGGNMAITIQTITPEIIGEVETFEQLDAHVFVDRATGAVCVIDGYDQGVLITQA